MSSVDTRIVNMQFNNRQFQEGIKDSLGSLEELQKGLNLADAAKGMATGIDKINSRFSTLGIIGMSALHKFTGAAIGAGRKMGNAISGPIFQGGVKRALNIEQAKFQFEGLGMDIEATMANANAAVDGTAYGLDEAAKVASQLGASGMRAGDDMVQSLRAVSGVAAMTNSSYEDVGRIFTTVAGNGRLMGNQLLQLSGRGLNAAGAIAEHMGISEAAVREMVSKGQIDFKLFSEAMDSAFGEHATSANKTFSGSLSNVKAALARIGASVATPALENLRNIFNALRPVINDINKALQPLIARFTEFTTVIAEKLVVWLEQLDFSNIGTGTSLFSGMLGILGPLGTAAFSLFKVFTDGLKNLSPAFVIFKDILSSVGDILSKFIGKMTKADEGTSLWENTLKAISFVMEKFADLVTGVLGVFAGLLGGFDSGVSVSENLRAAFERLSNWIKTLTERFTPLKKISEGVKWVFDAIRKSIEAVMPLFEKAWGTIKNILGSISFDNLMDGANLGLLATIALGIKKFVDSLSGGAGSIGDALGKIGSGFAQVGGLIDGLTGSLRAMQTDLKAKALIKIAGAVAILAGALILMSMVDPDKMRGALVAVSILISELFIAMLAFEKLTKGAGFKAMTKVSIAMLVLSTSILILASAMKKIGDLDMDQMVSSLAGIGGLMAALLVASKVMSTTSGELTKGSAGLVVFAVAINVLASAVEKLSAINATSMLKGLIGVMTLVGTLTAFLKYAKLDDVSATTGLGLMGIAIAIGILAKAVDKLAGLSVKEIIKGLGTMFALLGAIVIFTKTLDKSSDMLTTAASLTVLAIAVGMFAKTVERLGKMDPMQLLTGLTGLAVTLLLISVAIKEMPDDIGVRAVALLALAVAINSFAKTVGIFGDMSVKELVKGFLGLAAALVIMGVALKSMTGTIVGSAALLIAAAALAILAPVLFLLGSMSLAQIGKGLVAMGGAFLTLGLASVILTPVAPLMVLVALAILLLSKAVKSIGSGLVVFAAGLASASVSIATFATANSLALKTFVDLIVYVLETVITTFANIIKIVLTSAKEILEIVGPLLTTLLELIIKNEPLYFEAVTVLVTGILKTVTDLVPVIFQAGIDIIMSLLEGFTKNIGGVITAGVDAALAFIEGLMKELPRIVATAFEFVIEFINSLANTIRTKGPELRKAAWNLVTAIVEAILGGVIDMAKAGASLVGSFIKGIFGKKDSAKKEGKASGKAAVDGMEEGAKGGHSIGKNLIASMSGGISSMADSLGRTARSVAKGAVSAVERMLGIASPSKVFTKIGEFSGQGLVNGLAGMANKVKASAAGIGSTAIDSIKGAMVGVSNLLDGELELSPSITPVLDMSNGSMSGMNTIQDFIKNISLDPIVKVEQTVNMKHSFDKLVVEGVNDKNEFVASADYAVEDVLTAMMRRQSRL